MNDNQPKKLHDYDVMMGGGNDVFLVIDERDGDPDHPVIIIDAEHAVFARNKADRFEIAGLPKDAMARMLERGRSLVTETNTDGVVREYPVEVVAG